jgi:hypothetical protein
MNGCSSRYSGGLQSSGLRASAACGTLTGWNANHGEDNLDFHDRNGRAQIHTPDGQTLYTWSGTPVAFISGDAVHDYGGRTIARFTNGWIVDNNGYALLYSEHASGGPLPPLRQLATMKSLPALAPLPPLPSLPPLMPLQMLGWSQLSAKQIFPGLQ